MNKTIIVAALILSAGIIASTVVWQRHAADKRAYDAASKEAFAENMRRVVRRDEIAVAVRGLDQKIAAIVAEKDELRSMDTRNDILASSNDSSSAMLAAREIANARSLFPPEMAAAEIRRIQAAHKRDVDRNAEYRRMAAESIRRYEDTIELLRIERRKLLDEAASLGPVPYPATKK